MYFLHFFKYMLYNMLYNYKVRKAKINTIYETFFFAKAAKKISWHQVSNSQSKNTNCVPSVFTLLPLR